MLLPAPDGPTRPTVSPFAMLKSMPASAGAARPAYVNERPSTRMRFVKRTGSEGSARTAARRSSSRNRSRCPMTWETIGKATRDSESVFATRVTAGRTRHAVTARSVTVPAMPADDASPCKVIPATAPARTAMPRNSRRSRGIRTRRLRLAWTVERSSMRATALLSLAPAPKSLISLMPPRIWSASRLIDATWLR